MEQQLVSAGAQEVQDFISRNSKTFRMKPIQARLPREDEVGRGGWNVLKFFEIFKPVMLNVVRSRNQFESRFHVSQEVEPRCCHSLV